MTNHMYFLLLCVTEMIRNFGLELTPLGIKNKSRVILTNHSAVFKFLRLDYQQALRLKTNTELYNFIISSPYFNPVLFKITKLRAKYVIALPVEVKPIMVGFIRYLANKDNNIPIKYKYSRYLDLYDKVVDNFILRNKLQVISETTLRSQLAEKLNGALVMSWLDVKPGKHLGDMLAYFKTEIEKKLPYDVYLYNNTKENIKSDFIRMYTV
jgi:hypothetical protein